MNARETHSGRRCDGFEPRAEFQRHSRANLGAHENGAEACYEHARRLVGSLTAMPRDTEHNGGRGQSPTASRRFAQSTCRADDCTHDEAHPTDDAAIATAREHAAAEGHTLAVELRATDAPLIVNPTLPTCGRCEEPVTVRVGDGPSITDHTNQPCGCPPTAEAQR